MSGNVQNGGVVSNLGGLSLDSPVVTVAADDVVVQSIARFSVQSPNI